MPSSKLSNILVQGISCFSFYGWEKHTPVDCADEPSTGHYEQERVSHEVIQPCLFKLIMSEGTNSEFVYWTNNSIFNVFVESSFSSDCFWPPFSALRSPYCTGPLDIEGLVDRRQRAQPPRTAGYVSSYTGFRLIFKATSDPQNGLR